MADRARQPYRRPTDSRRDNKDDYYNNYYAPPSSRPSSSYAARPGSARDPSPPSRPAAVDSAPDSRRPHYGGRDTYARGQDIAPPRVTPWKPPPVVDDDGSSSDDDFEPVNLKIRIHGNKIMNPKAEIVTNQRVKGDLYVEITDNQIGS